MNTNTSSLSLTDSQRRSTTLRRLLEISLLLNSNQNIDSMLKEIMDAVCEITNAEASSILLYDRNADELHFAASNTPDTNIGELSTIPVPMEGSIAGQIVRENRVMVIQDARRDPRIYRPVDEQIGFRTLSLLGLPMQIKGVTVGVLEVVNKKDGQWTPEDSSAMQILASHAAVAIQNARQTDALRRAYNELDKLDKAKNDFIAIASHELRTPLGVIMGYASFLKDGTDGETGEFATQVLNSALHLRDLIENLTNLRYLQIGEMELISESVSLAHLLQMAHNEVQSLGAAKDQTMRLNLPPSDVEVHADRVKLTMAITNILNNAVKFTPPRGSVVVTVDVKPKEAVITVADNGRGIDPDQLESIFDKFYQVEDHMTRRENGMGLGLSIARAIIDAHKGRLWATSPGVGQGASFHIALPLAE